VTARSSETTAPPVRWSMPGCSRSSRHRRRSGSVAPRSWWRPSPPRA
jgi:hypothetical protein